MPTRIDRTTEATGESLPAYSEAPPYTEAAESEAASSSSRSAGVPPAAAPPPDYRQASFTPYVPIPTTLYGFSKTAYRGLHLCADADGRAKLFYAVHHTGMSGTGPLGGRLGVHLHNGLDNRAPVLAAAGQRLQHESFRERTSVVLLPPHMPPAADHGGGSRNVVGIASYTDVLMEVHNTRRGPPVFRLKLEIGAGTANTLRPAKFAWCRGLGAGGNEYTLVRKLFRHGERYAAAGASRCAFPRTEDEERAAAEKGSAEDDDGEVVAVLTCGSALKTWGRGRRRLFTIELRGSAAWGLLGERCTVMIVTTAVRVYQMHEQGMTSRSTFWGSMGKHEKKNATEKKSRKEEGKAADTLGQAVDAAALLSELR
ncbi:uncharacterized protein LMH87_008961 [Akanthomyces muscarius]|uniref:Uncharacterized protein n=1 Tax=Akanthomyces muscarius TaxID=2231603 RepID=A0A9W8UMH4_AKAMU|nr:uncharacterized protein LMH87_008961 [Akanthomyces muscarius]KAJ4158435.1 hypothetical protein LMH87_008961 [Akanthomyces muscarius]